MTEGAVRADRGLQRIVEENDLMAYKADASGFLWALLEVARHGEGFSEPDFQALVERGRLAAQGQAGLLAHAEDVRGAVEAVQEERRGQFETSQPGVGPPRPVMPGESGTPLDDVANQGPAEAPAEDEDEELTEEEAEAEEGAEETDAERAEAEAKALERGLEIRDTAQGWRVFDPKTGRMVSR